jgi:hypothetical protein
VVSIALSKYINDVVFRLRMARRDLTCCERTVSNNNKNLTVAIAGIFEIYTAELCLCLIN